MIHIEPLGTGVNRPLDVAVEKIDSRNGQGDDRLPAGPTPRSPVP
jgi:hypothetical protein